MKSKLEDLDIDRDYVTIASLDIEMMYPLIKYRTIRDAVEFFFDSIEGVSDEDKNDLWKQFECCLEMIGFGLANTFLTHDGKIYQNDVGRLKGGLNLL